MDNHISTSELQGYLNGTLVMSKLQRVLIHYISCSNCRGQVAKLKEDYQSELRRGGIGIEQFEWMNQAIIRLNELDNLPTFAN